MKFEFYQKRLSHVNVQRNFLICFAVVMLLVMLLQTLLLFVKQQRVIISPPELKQSYWVQGNLLSKSYVEEMALFFAHLLLDVTESNLLLQGYRFRCFHFSRLKFLEYLTDKHSI